MSDSDSEILQSALRIHWPQPPTGKVLTYVGKFFEGKRIGTAISARVKGNHGVYTVSIRLDKGLINSACSCYIGKHGYCHHCVALAATFLNNPAAFSVVERKQREDVHQLADLNGYLAHITLESLLQQLKEQGITQTAFAQSIGSSSQHLAAVKKSELRNRPHNELGALKLACMWMLEHRQEFTAISKK